MRGLRVTWTLGDQKREQWTTELRAIIKDNIMYPGQTSKVCGRLAFLIAFVFNRLGRALLRPLIWRQTQTCGPFTVTARLRLALRWFVAVLEHGLCRSVSLERPITPPTIIIYSDAEGSGGIGAVAEFPSGEIWVRSGEVPAAVRKLLRARKTQIVAYELLAALVDICSLAPDQLRAMRVVHFIERTPALRCVVRGFSKQQDLALIAAL